MVIIPGLVGPKEMAIAESDGQLVNIPALLLTPDGGTEQRRFRALLVMRVGGKVERALGKSGALKLECCRKRKSQDGLNGVE